LQLHSRCKQPRLQEKLKELVAANLTLIRTDCMTMSSAVNMPYWNVSSSFAGCLGGAFLVPSNLQIFKSSRASM